MKFEIIGNLNNPLIMMLTGSFYINKIWHQENLSLFR